MLAESWRRRQRARRRGRRSALARKPRVRRRIVGVFDASTSPLKEWIRHNRQKRGALAEALLEWWVPGCASLMTRVRLGPCCFGDTRVKILILTLAGSVKGAPNATGYYLILSFKLNSVFIGKPGFTSVTGWGTNASGSKRLIKQRR